MKPVVGVQIAAAGIGKRAKSAIATREAILSAARDAFSRLGYDGAGLREIATAAGATAALVNRYFGSKEALFVEAIAETLSAEALIGGDRLTFGERLARYILAKPRDLDGFEPVLAMIRSSSNPRAAALMRDNLEVHFARPLADWLGTSNANERAGSIIAAIAGLAVMRDVIQLSALAHPTETLIRLNGRMLQSLIDGG